VETFEKWEEDTLEEWGEEVISQARNLSVLGRKMGERSQFGERHPWDGTRKVDDTEDK
jgi:hypothetical protein